MTIYFRKTEQIFQGIKEFKADSGQRFRVDSEGAPLYSIFELNGDAWIFQTKIKARSADSAMDAFLNGSYDENL